MAKAIDLTQRNRQAQPAAAPTQQMQTPPPAQPTATVHAAPLNVGQVVVGNANTRLTPMELAGQPQSRPMNVPPGVAQLVQANRAAQTVHIDPVPLDFVPRIAETVNIEQLSPELQAQVRSNIRGVQQLHAQPTAAPNLSNVLQKPPAVAQQPVTVPEAPTFGSQAVPGWRPPGQPNYVPQVPLQPQMQQPAQVEDDVVINDLNMPEATLQSGPATELPLETMGAPEQLAGECPHCQWPLNVPDIPEPTTAERQAYLQSILGSIPFMQDYTLLGGSLRVRFRTLTTRELDTIFKQAAYERETGLIHSQDDFFEVVNRYRLYLQLQQIDGGPGFLHDFPDGFTLQTNPGATAEWILPEPEDPRATALPAIAEHMLTILSTETLMRAMQNICSKFNRLVSKLEAMIEHSDFWKPTGEQS